MNKEFIPYEQALALKELEFNEPCFGHYLKKQFYLKAYDKQGDGITLRPTYSQAFRWFEDNQSLYVERVVSANANEIMDISYRIISWRFRPIEIVFENPYDCFDKYKADFVCLKKLIEIAKNK